MTPRDRRALVWGALTVGAALLGLRVLPLGLRGVAAWQARASDRQATLARTRALLAAVPHLKDSLADLLPRVVALAPHLVAGRSAAEASASLTSLVGFAATRHGLKVVRMDPLPDSAVGVFGRVAVHAELEGDIRGLTRILQAVETGEPLLTVQTLGVDVADRNPRSEAPETLRVGLTVAGYFLPRDGR
jgi:type II secretory pathway component PulM